MNEVNPKPVVKIGEYRINLNHVTYVSELSDVTLGHGVDGRAYLASIMDENTFKGTLVYVHFAGNEDTTIKLLDKQAEEFLRLYDLCFAIGN